jgi:hypothetical protein
MEQAQKAPSLVQELGGGLRPVGLLRILCVAVHLIHSISSANRAINGLPVTLPENPANINLSGQGDLIINGSAHSIRS